MKLPVLTCPACAAEMTLDVVFGHAGTREAVEALVRLDPANRMLPAAMRYCALFAPAKQRLRHERLADLLKELQALIEPATLQTQGGATYATPREYWIRAMEEMTGPGRERLSLPLKSHGYLRRIVAGIAEEAARSAEKRSEDQRAGRTPVGVPPPAPAPPPQARAVREPKRGIPAHIGETLKQFGSRRPGAGNEKPDTESEENP